LELSNSGNPAKIIKNIAEDATVGDFFAGNGLLAAMASAFGIKMIASDLTRSSNPFCKVLKSDAINAVKKHPNISNFVISWPPQNDSIGEKFLKEILSRQESCRPVTIFYFGTPKGGCCGTPGFFDLLDTHFNVIASVDRSETETWSEIMYDDDGNPIFDGFVVYQQK